MLRILLPLLFLILLTACSPVHAEPAFPSCVDTNGDGVIDRDEVLAVVAAYFAGPSEPTPTSEPTGAPTVTALIPGDGTLTVHWTSPVQASNYWVEVSKKGWGQPRTYNEPSSPQTYRDLTIGAYTVRVSVAGPNPLWSEPQTATITVATPPTPTPIVPRQRICQWSSYGSYLNEYIHQNYDAWVETTNPVPPSQLWHDDIVSWGIWFKFWDDGRYWRDEEGPAFVLTAVEDGRWTLNLRNYKDEPVYTIDHGDLSHARVSFGEDWKDKNRMEVFAKGGEDAYDPSFSVTFTVNGIDVPVTIDDEDRTAIQNLYDMLFLQGMEGRVGLTAKGNAVFDSDPRPLGSVRFGCRNE